MGACRGEAEKTVCAIVIIRLFGAEGFGLSLEWLLILDAQTAWLHKAVTSYFEPMGSFYEWVDYFLISREYFQDLLTMDQNYYSQISINSSAYDVWGKDDYFTHLVIHSSINLFPHYLFYSKSLLCAVQCTRSQKYTDCCYQGD